MEAKIDYEANAIQQTIDTVWPARGRVYVAHCILHNKSVPVCSSVWTEWRGKIW